MAIDLERETWNCRKCKGQLGKASESYKKGCLIYDRDPREIYRAVIEGDITFSPDPRLCRILEFYCPSCGLMIECEILPPGHPITNDIEFDLYDLKSKIEKSSAGV